MYMMESIFDSLLEEINEGRKVNKFIPIGLPRLGKYANIRKRILTLLFSSTGCGKSGMIDTIILNACDYHMKHPKSMKPDFQLFSMERNSKLRIAKWLCYLIFNNEGIVIQLPTMMGWWEEKLNDDEMSLINKQKIYVDKLLKEYVTIHEGKKTPNEIYKIMKDHFEEVGKYEKITTTDKNGNDRITKIYTPNDEEVIVCPIFDHGNLTKTTKELPTKKLAIDKLVEMVQDFRDLEGAAPIWVSQVNRTISGVTRSKDGEHELILDDVKESGDIVDACDIAISLYDPIKFNQSSKTGYPVLDFIDKSNGNNYFRSAQILKSSYGADSIRIPLAFNGFCGNFMELANKKDLSSSEYESLIASILDKSFFLKNL